MRQLPDDISFDRWIRHVFDHPVLDPEWWFQDDESEHFEYWNEEADPARTLAYLTQLFAGPAFLIERYSRAQIDQGLNYLVSPSCSNYMFVLTDTSLPWPKRESCIEAMVPLYSKLMAAVYGDDQGRTQRGVPEEQPTFGCYMWWDLIPLYGGMKHPDRDRITDAVFYVFEETLKLKEEACLESILHGLCEWHMYLPKRVKQIVRHFLETRSDISDELRRYAKMAAVGAVL